jgi:hypothetical protein
MGHGNAREGGFDGGPVGVVAVKGVRQGHGVCRARVCRPIRSQMAFRDK